MGKRIFKLQLDDYSAPPIISSDKNYFGSIDMIESFVQANAEENNIDGLLKGIVPAKMIAAREHNLQSFQWTHLNVWRWPYDMKCDAAKCSHVWIVCQSKYMRCIKVEFTNLKYKLMNDTWGHPSMIWGYPHQIEVEGNKTYTRLFCIEKHFKNKDELLSDIQSFDLCPDPNFEEVLNDIFGDG